MLTVRQILVVAVLSGVGAGCGESPEVTGQQGTAKAIVAPALPDTVVDVAPRRESGPDVVYPDSLREAGVEGRVVVAGVVETGGTVDPASVAVLTSTHAGFEEAAVAWLTRASFSPGTVGGKSVRVRVEVPIEFRLSQE
jgi:TonB family protein